MHVFVFYSYETVHSRFNFKITVSGGCKILKDEDKQKARISSKNENCY